MCGFIMFYIFTIEKKTFSSEVQFISTKNSTQICLMCLPFARGHNAVKHVYVFAGKSIYIYAIAHIYMQVHVFLFMQALISQF